MEIRLYDTYCYNVTKCPKPLFKCTTACSYSPATDVATCTAPAATVANKPIFAMMVYRSGGSSKAQALNLTIDVTP
jgi:hypothetical protein